MSSGLNPNAGSFESRISMPSKDWADETEGTIVESKKPAAAKDGQ